MPDKDTMSTRLLHIGVRGFKLIFASAVLSLLPLNTLGQPVSNGNASQDAELQIAGLEQSYDSQVIQVISNHFDRKKFFVDTNINADLINDTLITTGSQITSNQQQRILMPGLPFLPLDNLQIPNSGSSSTGGGTALSSNIVRSLRLVNISISVYADTSFNTQEIDFMRQIASFAAKLDTTRGDQLTITQLAIPDPEFEPIAIESTNNFQQPEAPKTFFERLSDHITDFILFGLFLLALIGNNIFNRNRESASTLRLERGNIQANLNLDGNLPAGISTGGNTSETPTFNLATEEEFSMKEFDELTKNFFTKPEETALLLEYWIDEDPIHGAAKAAEIVAAGDKNIIKSIKKDLPEDKYNEVVRALDELPSMTIEEKNKAAKYFNTLIKESSDSDSPKKNYANLGLFKFLEHVTTQQLMELLKNETNQTAALVLDYLSEEKAAELINKLDSKKAAEIMLKISTLHNLSYKQHSLISARLFDKMVEIRDIEKQKKLGLESILPILEKLPVNEQKGYIEQIKESGSALGEILETQFLTVDQISDLEIDIIKEGVEPLNTPTLMESLVGMEKNVVDKVLSVRPKREQKLIRMELENMKGSEGSDEAKSKLLSSLRKSYSTYLEEAEQEINV